ncbi:hypothetical protein QTU67_002633 [Vibrio cholerae]|uniref:GNAT family N-acetyltransferase n=1 Tax=Vibrio cholerae TaxID=666 RepID=D6NLZ4_VIBCL|nr:hypothetical protein [Vibrio cholerae]ADF80979.1 hypothetical protein [Vibrio cholerae]EGQ7881100.1 methicillin resistance protein [Vibrio cholerae]EGQ9321832.1 methicillin resistance protein [Vibrio cholerae]EGQ9436445.1 methicillin resistance protein [Vibrio cholerae]EGQ9634391.1 methicillin resistance protein [Vibrio cholerae]
MTELSIRYFSEDDSIEWDSFIELSHKGTFLHSRKFLSYHGDRFVDRSLIVEDRNKIVAVLPACQTYDNKSAVVSHLGATYGGLITSASCYGEDLISVMHAICVFYRNEGFSELCYKVTPSVYHNTIDEDEIYALFRLNAELVRVDNNAVVDKYSRLKVSNQRKRSFKKARDANLTLFSGFENLEDFYSVLLSNLSEKHNAKPVHTISELRELKFRFNKEIELVVAKNEVGYVISGVVFFNINNVVHSQYIASSSEGYDKGGLDFIFEKKIDDLLENQQRFLAFGTSNESNGKVLNQSLYRFKRQFGAGSVAHQYYSIKL